MCLKFKNDPGSTSSSLQEPETTWSGEGGKLAGLSWGAELTQVSKHSLQLLWAFFVPLLFALISDISVTTTQQRLCLFRTFGHDSVGFKINIIFFQNEEFKHKFWGFFKKLSSLRSYYLGGFSPKLAPGGYKEAGEGILWIGQEGMALG